MSTVDGIAVTNEMYEERRSVGLVRGGPTMSSNDHTEAITSLAYANVAQDSILISGARDGIVKVWK